MTITAPRDLHARPRRAVHGPPPKRLVRPTGLLWALLVVLMLLLGGLSAAVARADEPERYTPASRGPRASYGTDQVERWRELVDAYRWPTETALLVIACESQGDPDAVNPSSGAAGLFQLYGWSWLARRLFGDARVLIPWVNVGTAFALWEDSGGRFSWHWQASIRCWGW